MIHKRVLVAEGTSYNRPALVTEFLLMEVSPSGNYVKVRDFDGRRFWKIVSDVRIIEILDFEKEAKK